MAEQDNHWSHSGEAGTIFGMRVLLLLYRVFGRWGFRVALAPAMAYFFLMRSEARQSSKEYLQKVASTMDPPVAKLSVFAHFWMFGEVLLDKLLVWMGEMSPRDLVIKTPEMLAEMHASSRGGVIIVSHLGNNEMTSALAEQLTKTGITMLVYTRHAEKFNQLMKSAQGRANIRMMQVTDMSPATAMLLSERVSNGEYVVIAGDRTPVTGDGRASQVKFLGATATMPQGAFILAGVLSCPVYLLFCVKQKSLYHLYLEKFSEPMKIPRKQRELIINEMVQRYADRLAEYCRLAPLQWFNFFPFWKI